MDEDDIRAYDEAITLLLRTVPTALHSFFVKVQEEGFSESQAMELTKCYMIQLMGFGKK
jgi:hypothetical protein